MDGVVVELYLWCLLSFVFMRFLWCGDEEHPWWVFYFPLTFLNFIYLLLCNVCLSFHIDHDHVIGWRKKKEFIVFIVTLHSASNWRRITNKLQCTYRLTTTTSWSIIIKVFIFIKELVQILVHVMWDQWCMYWEINFGRHMFWYMVYSYFIKNKNNKNNTTNQGNDKKR